MKFEGQDKRRVLNVFKKSHLGVVAKQCESKIPPESEGGELAPPLSVSKSRKSSRWWWRWAGGGGGTPFGASNETPPL